MLLIMLCAVIYFNEATATNLQPLPTECLTATNLTESWRLDHKGSDIRPGGPHSLSGWACDLHKDLKWFRFSGDGGTLVILIMLYTIYKNGLIAFKR